MTHYRSPLGFRTKDDADGGAGERLTAVEQQLGRVPNMYGAMANSPGLLATCLDGYQRFRSGSGLTEVDDVFAGHAWTVPQTV